MPRLTTPTPSRTVQEARRSQRRAPQIVGLERWTPTESQLDLGTVAAAVETPALVLDLGAVKTAMQAVERVRAATGCHVLYALKPLAHPGVLRAMAGRVDGFAASSLFEAKLARAVAGETGSVHLTSPGLRLTEAEALGALCDHVVFNSLEQSRRVGSALPRAVSQGMRVNPGLPFVDDDRYNPCRAFSKLGVPIERLARSAERGRDLKRIAGFHFHTNCEGQTYRPLLETVDRVIDRLDGLLRKLAWVNLGGGYLLEPPPPDGIEPLVDAVRKLRDRYGVAVYIEPGAALVRAAGFLVATVIDLFKHQGKRIAVLDTTVNHMPEVFEYQFEPDILGDHADGEHEVLLAGGTCLAGDLFGEYGFDRRVRVGDRVIFPDAGAYTLVKAHMFNGINLPAVYTVSVDGELDPGHRLDYHDYLRRCGVESDAAL